MGFDSRSLDQGIASVEEFADISAKVLLEHKLAAWVHFFISVEIQNEIVKD